MHFLRVNVTFYDAVNMVHDVITIAYPFPDTAKVMFVGVRNNKTEQGSKFINSPNLDRYFSFTATLCTYSLHLKSILSIFIYTCICMFLSTGSIVVKTANGH